MGLHFIISPAVFSIACRCAAVTRSYFDRSIIRASIDLGQRTDRRVALPVIAPGGAANSSRCRSAGSSPSNAPARQAASTTLIRSPMIRRRDARINLNVGVSFVLVFHCNASIPRPNYDRPAARSRRHQKSFGPIVPSRRSPASGHGQNSSACSALGLRQTTLRMIAGCFARQGHHSARRRDIAAMVIAGRSAPHVPVLCPVPAYMSVHGSK